MLEPEEILQAALKLDPKQREHLLDQLWASLDTDLSPEWQEEIAARIEAVDSGKMKTIPGDEVMSRLKQRFGVR